MTKNNVSMSKYVFTNLTAHERLEMMRDSDIISLYVYISMGTDTAGVTSCFLICCFVVGSRGSSQIAVLGLQSSKPRSGSTTWMTEISPRVSHDWQSHSVDGLL